MDKKYTSEGLLELISICRDPAIFLGLAKCVGVDLYAEKDKPKDFQNLLEETLILYAALSRKRRREVWKMFKKTLPERTENAN